MKRPKAERMDGAKGRFYRVEGKEYPSVTSILQVIAKPALVAWSAKVERELVKEVSGRLYQQSQALQEPLSLPQWLLRLEDMLGKEKAHTKELAKAGEIGSQVHALIEFTLRMELCEKVGPSPALEPKAQFAYAEWQKWRQSVKLKPLMVEFTVVSHKYGYAGTADLLGRSQWCSDTCLIGRPGKPCIGKLTYKMQPTGKRSGKWAWAIRSKG